MPFMGVDCLLKGGAAGLVICAQMHTYGGAFRMYKCSPTYKYGKCRAVGTDAYLAHCQLCWKSLPLFVVAVRIGTTGTRGTR